MGINIQMTLLCSQFRPIFIKLNNEYTYHFLFLNNIFIHNKVTFLFVNSVHFKFGVEFRMF